MHATAPAETSRVSPSAPARPTLLFARPVTTPVASKNAAHQPAWVKKEVLGQNGNALSGVHRNVHHAITAITGNVKKKTFDRPRRRRRSRIHTVSASEAATQRSLSRKREGYANTHPTPAASRGARKTAVGRAISPRRSAPASPRPRASTASTPASPTFWKRVRPAAMLMATGTNTWTL